MNKKDRRCYATETNSDRFVTKIPILSMLSLWPGDKARQLA
jgi:hypothetical protein